MQLSLFKHQWEAFCEITPPREQLRILAARAGHFSLIINIHGEYITTAPWDVNHPNKGLPDWFFRGGFYFFEVNLHKDTIEWVPDVGPAPCWFGKFSQFDTLQALVINWKEWVKRTY